jgi:hypothetical protein
MATIKNQDSTGDLSAGVTLTVSDVASENDAILAVENHLREHKKEGLEVVLQESGDGSFTIRLEEA